MRPSKLSVSNVLRRTILESGKSLKSISEETGVERMSISRFVAGTQSLRLDKADLLCEYFGIEAVSKRSPKDT